MEDGPPGELTTSERLELLRRYEASWKNIKWNEDNTQAFTHSVRDFGDSNPGKLYGNVWAHSRELERDAIDFVQLPSRLRRIPMRQWTLRFDFSVQNFGMDPCQDLLVMIETGSQKYVQ